MRILFLLLLSFLSLHAHSQAVPGIIAASTYYRGDEEPPYTSMWDNAQNTAVDGKQVVGVGGDSKAEGNSPTANDFGPEPFYQNTIFQYVASVTALNTGDVNNASNGSPWMKLAIDYYRWTGYNAVLVPRGSGGSTATPISGNNDWSTTGSRYTPFVNALNNACAAIGTSEPRMTVWDLLVNDARQWDAGTSGFNLAAIETNFRSLLTRLTTDFPNTPHYFILPGREEDGVTTEIQQVNDMAVLAIADYDNCFIAFNEIDYVDMIYQADGLHYSKYGNIFVGASVIKTQRTLGHLSNTPITYTYTTEAQQVLDRLTDETDNESKWLNDFIGYLHDSGDLAKMVSMQCFALQNEDNARQDLLRSATATFTGVTHHGGVTTTGSTGSYIDTGFNPTAHGGGVYTLNSSSLGFFLIENNQATSTLATLMGVIGSTTGTTISVSQGSSNGIIYRMHSNSGGTFGTGNPLPYSVYQDTRTASNSNILNQDGTGGSSTAATSAIPNRTVKIGGRDNNGSMDLPYAGKFGFFYASSGTIQRFKVQTKIMELMIDLEVNPSDIELTYVPFPTPPTLSDTHTLVQATTGTGIQSGDLGGKQNFYVSGNYSFMQFNVVNTDDYALRSLDVTSPATWSKIGSPSPQDYAIDEVNAAHGYSFYNLWFRDADNLIKKRPFDTLGVLSPIVFQNCIFTDAGFGGILINQNIVGRGYGKMNVEFCSFTGGGAERIYGGSTGSPNTKYRDTTTVTHLYSDSSRREVVQLNNHKYVRVSNVTGRHVGVVQEEPPQGIGQENGFQCQGCGGGYIKNSIFESTAPGMIASTSLDLINNRITWSKTDRAMYLQDLVGNGYAYKNVDDDTVVIDGNDFICPGFTLPYVIYIQEDDFVVVIKNNRFPPSATSVYTCSGPCPTIIMSGNTFDSDLVPPVTFGDHPNPDYAPYWKVVTSEYDYLKGRGALTPEP